MIESTHEKGRTRPMRLWIDTDIGSDVDDALTLAYALRHPGIEVVGLSTVFGDVELRTRIAYELLDRAGSPEVPIVTGLGKPLTPGRNGRMFGHEGLGLFDDPNPAPVTGHDVDAEARIATLAEALDRVRPDALLAIGPMTNLGALARAGVALPPLTVMGGKVADVEIPGTLPQIPEWNWWCDPHAVAATLEAGTDTPPRVVPIEVTMQTVLPEAEWARLAAGDALARMLHALCGEWMTALRDRLGSKRPAVHLHDPLAAMAMVDAAVCTFANHRIRIDDAGVTHSDASQGAEVEVAEHVDVARLVDQLMRVWLGETT